MALTTGQLIKNTRKRIGLSQEQVAERFGTVSAAISQWEKDKRNPKPENLLRLAASMGTSVADFLDVSDSERGEIQKYENQLAELSALIKTCENNPGLVYCMDEYKTKFNLAEEHLKHIIQIAAIKNRSKVLSNRTDAMSESTITPTAKDNAETVQPDQTAARDDAEAKQETAETVMHRYCMVELESVLDKLSPDGRLELVKRAKELSCLPQYQITSLDPTNSSTETNA